MPASRENDRRDKALEDIARQLKETNQHLSQLVKLNTPKTTLVRPNPFTQPQEPQPILEETPEQRVQRLKEEKDSEEKGPVFPKSDNPYFKNRSAQVEPRGDSNTQGIG